MMSLAVSLLTASSSLVLPSAIQRGVAPARAAVDMKVKAAIPDKNVWVSFAKTNEVKKGEAISGFQYGQEIAIVCTPKGALYAMANKLPPTGQPATLGDVQDDVIVDPLSSTAFNLKTGKVQGPWCPSLIGKLLLGRLIAPQGVPVYKVRTQGGTIQVLINVNAKAQFENNYWRGVLDAQGKVDGGYY